MRNLVLLSLVAVLWLPVAARAESQDACAIWLCLPAGFPSGCSGAYDEFRHRIKKGRPPLPALSSCSEDGKTDGHYQLGYEIWEECKDGYVLREAPQGSWRQAARCYEESCAPEQYQESNYYYCQSYDAVRRAKPNYVKMWVDGEYLGQFFY